MSPQERDPSYVITIGAEPEEVAALARALKGEAVVVAASDAGLVGSLLQRAASVPANSAMPDVVGPAGASGAAAAAGRLGARAPGTAPGTPGPADGVGHAQGIVDHSSGVVQSREEQRRLAVGPLCIDRGLHQVTIEGRVVEFSAREFDLLCLLAGDMEKVWTFAELTKKVWKTSYLGDADMLVSAVKRLRRRLAAVGDGIQVVSVRGVGFRLVAREVPAAKARVNSSSGVLRVLDASV